jgi:hypothetical protein
MKLTQKQKEMLESFWESTAKTGQFRSSWIEPLEQDNKNTLKSLVKKGIFECNPEDGFYRVSDLGEQIVLKDIPQNK